MVYLVKKKISGHKYLYLTKTARVDGISKVVWQKYLGREDTIEQKDLQFDFADPDSYTMEDLDFGLPVAMMQLVERLDMINIINQSTHKRDQGISVGEYMVLATLQRCINPRSKNQLKRWFETTYLKEYMPNYLHYLNSDAYTNHFNYLTEEIINRIELQLQQRIKSEFDVDYSSLYYDPTNFYTFINPRGPKQELAKHGKSKESRHILNLVAMSMICTNDGGIPVTHHVYPGNIQDAGHFKTRLPQILKRLKDMQLKYSEVTLVFDKGNISQEIFEQIDQAGVRFICSVRPSTHKDLHDLRESDFSMIKLPNDKDIGVKEFDRDLHGKSRRLIVCYNPNKMDWSGGVKLHKLQKKLDEIEEWFETKLNTHKWRNTENVAKKIKSIIGKNNLEFFDIKIGGQYADVNYSVILKDDEVDNFMELLGKSYYATNLDDDPGVIIWKYRQQYKIEKLFKYIKHVDFIRIRPIYHRNDSSIRGHIFACFLALLLLTLLEREVNKSLGSCNSVNQSTSTILAKLAEIRLIKIQAQRSKSASKAIYKMVNVSGEAEELMKMLNLSKYIP